METDNGAVAPAIPQLRLAGSSAHPLELIGRVWAARELCGTLARKDFFVRYRRATFGILWAVAVPVIQAVVLSQVLGRVTNLAVPHFTVYVFSGIAGWSYFSQTLAGATTSIVDNSSMSSRIYFPRSVLPIASALSNVFTLGVTSTILFVVVLSSNITLHWKLLTLIPAALLCVLLTASLGLVLSALHVYFRDVLYIVQASLLVLFYLTPVFYPMTRLHNGVVRDIVVANPLTGIAQLFHWAVLPTPNVAAPLYSTLIWTACLCALALFLHSRLDRSFADML
ncbi:MAG: ABC transporter permease [Mycobacteriales bacterium]